MGGRYRLFCLWLLLLMASCVSRDLPLSHNSHNIISHTPQNGNVSLEESKCKAEHPELSNAPRKIGKTPWHFQDNTTQGDGECPSHFQVHSSSLDRRKELEEIVSWKIIYYLGVFNKSSRMACCLTRAIRHHNVNGSSQAGKIEFWDLDAIRTCLRSGKPNFLLYEMEVNLLSILALMLYIAMSSIRQILLTSPSSRLLTDTEEDSDTSLDSSRTQKNENVTREDIFWALRSLMKGQENMWHRSIIPELNEIVRPPGKPRWFMKRKIGNWMCDPHWWRSLYRIYFVFPAFELLASFRGLYERMLPDNVSAVQLAEAGFKFTGNGNIVQCQWCKQEVAIEHVTSSPDEARYHAQGCSKVENVGDDSSVSTYASCNSEFDEGFGDFDQIETDSAEPSSQQSTFQELARKRDDERGIAENTQLQENITEASDDMAQMDIPHFEETNGQPPQPPNSSQGDEKISGAREMYLATGSDSGRESLRYNDSASTSSSGYSTASASSTSGIIPANSAASESSADTNSLDEGFVDLKTFTTEAEPDCSKHDQVPPVLTIPCQKNKGHYAYFPIRQLELKYIPSHARYQEVLEFLKFAAMLTVRIVVNITSDKRPEDDPARQSQSRLGTGSCFERQAEILNKGSDGEQPGKWNSMKKLFSGKKFKPGRIYVETTRHVVFDDTEAQNTEVEFFYDHPNRKEVVCVRGMSVEHSRTHGNYKSILTCKTSDLGLVERLVMAREKMMKLFRSFSPAIKEGLLRRIFIIGHPHGGEKVLSYGDSVIIKYALTKQMENGRTVHGMVKISNNQQVTEYGDNARKVLLYTADTCQGSSGSPIITFKTCNENDCPGSGAGAGGGQEVIQMELWMHNGVDIKHGLGGSVMKELTAEDIANHGKPSGTRSSVQDNMSRNNGGDGQSSFSEVVSCPVFTVVGHPSYPAYVAYQSRLDSYNEWRYHQIHSPVHLSEAGFFYAGYADCVRCFQCGLGLRSWKEGDDVYVEHYKNRPNCQFLQMQLRVRGIDDPETQLRPQAQENISDRGFDGNGTRGNEMPKIAMMVQQTLSSSTSTESHQLWKSEEAVMTQVNTLERDSATRPVQISVVGFVTDCPAVQGRSPSERETQHHPGAASSSGVASGEKDLTYILLERENQFLQKQLTCKVCFKKPIKDLFLPCGELYACTDCSKLLTHCPSCQKQILATVTTYFT